MVGDPSLVAEVGCKSTSPPAPNVRDQVAVAYYARVNVQGIRRDALIDTGASITMMSLDYFNAIPNVKFDQSPSSVFNIEGVVPGSKLDVVGSVTVPLKLGLFLSAPHQVIVCRDTRHEFLVGMDFLDRFFASVDTTCRMLRIKPPNSDLISVHLTPRFANDQKEYKVTCKTRVKIPPRSTSFLEVRVENLVGGGDGCIEPLGGDVRALMVPHCLATVKNGSAFIECINVDTEPLMVELGHQIGMFAPMDGCYLAEPGDAVVSEYPDSDVLELFDLEGADLTEHQRELVRELLNRHRSVVGTSDLDMGLTHTVEHEIDVEGAVPLKQPYRRFPDPLKKEIQEEIGKLLERGIVEPSKSPWASPMVPVRKKTGKLRICIDYRGVNSKTRKDSFPLPNLNDAISKFTGCTYFSSLDLLAGYHQIAMSKDSQQITAFSDGQTLYEFTRMPFGVCNGPASFSRLMAVVLSGIPFETAQAYLDDILVSGRDFEEHFRNLDLVLARLSAHGLKLSASKCCLFRPEVEYLGHMVGREGVKPLQKNVQAVLDYPKPTTVKQLRSFNGMVNFYKRFLDKSEEIMKPLYRATAGRQLLWTPECTAAFQNAKQALTEAPVLAYPDFDGGSPFIVTTDASGCGAGAVLSQLQGGTERVIAYAGTSFNDAQLRYSPTDRELAAIRFAVVHFKTYLYGRHYIVRTDHQPLIYLYKMKRFDDRLHRTMEDLNIGNFEFEYLPGKVNIVADALSRAGYPWKLPDDDDARVVLDSVVNWGDMELVRVPGGANSLFDAVAQIHPEYRNSSELRSLMVRRILRNPLLYGYQNNAPGRRRVELLEYSDEFPPLEAVQALVDELQCRLVVHFYSGPAVTLKSVSTRGVTLHLQCHGGVHFDAIIDRSSLVKGDSEVVNQIQVDPSIEEVSAGPLYLNSEVGELGAAQERDSVLSELRQLVELPVAGSPPRLPGYLSGFRSKWDHLTIGEDGLLSFRVSESLVVPVVPESHLQSLAEELHVVLKHTGRDKTQAVMAGRMYHPRFPAVIADVVQKCIVCQAHKGQGSHKHPVYRRRTDRPYQLYAVDLMELPKSKRGFNCVLTGIDLHTKFAHAVPLKCKRSIAVARALESCILATVPKTPEAILSDNGPEFRGAAFEELLREYGVTHEYSVPYASNTNGAVERWNQTLRSRLATACNDESRHWDQHLYGIVSQYNRTPHSETGKAPVEFFQEHADINVPSEPYWKLPRNFKPFEVGDLVWRKTPYQRAGEKDKLGARFQGPLRVVERDSNNITYRAMWLRGKRNVIKLHASQMKHYHGTWVDDVDTLVPPDCPKAKAPRISPKPAPAQVPVQGGSLPNIFDIGWERLTNIPCSIGRTEEVVVPSAIEELEQAEGAGLEGSGTSQGAGSRGVDDDMSRSTFSQDAEGGLFGPVVGEPVGLANVPGEVGSWMLSPPLGEVISDGCIEVVPASTPQLGPTLRRSERIRDRLAQRLTYESSDSDDYPYPVRLTTTLPTPDLDCPERSNVHFSTVSQPPDEPGVEEVVSPGCRVYEEGSSTPSGLRDREGLEYVSIQIDLESLGVDGPEASTSVSVVPLEQQSLPLLSKEASNPINAVGEQAASGKTRGGECCLS